MKIISGQRYLDTDLVEEKIKNEDFTVYVSPVFTFEGDEYSVVTDGHHSLAAAKAASVNPTFVTQTTNENDTIGLLEKGDIETFLELCQHDSDFYDIKTGLDIW